MNYYKKQEDKMETKYLVIMEVSQKQAFIFSSNELKDNVTNSAIIAKVTSPEFFEEVIKDKNIYNTNKNIVYSGGGHTVLVFDTEEQARTFVQIITYHVMKYYEGLELFAKQLKCEGKITEKDLKQLSQELEVKKSKRKSAFHQGSFGIEALKNENSKISKEIKNKILKEEKDKNKELMPDDFKSVEEFAKLGGSKNKSNFIAVVHIDGNAMGKRVEEFRKSMKRKSWEEYRKAQKTFSDSIDKDFKNAYKEMAEEVKKAIGNEKLKELNLEDKNFPVRRIITAGDDICFVAEGRIGIECAVIFLKKLAQQKNKQDKKQYSACAGVAIVHQKYPFYRAYELAENLCSNAKKFVANLDPKNEKISGVVSAIDWHIEYGEMKESLEEIREMYQIEDQNDPSQLELRPYIVEAPLYVKEKEHIRLYENFKKLMRGFSDEEISYARGKIKELRRYLKQGEESAKYYMKTNLIDELGLIGYQGIYEEIIYKGVGSGKSLEEKTFIETKDRKKRCLLFDVIEAIDTFIALDEE